MRSVCCSLTGFPLVIGRTPLDTRSSCFQLEVVVSKLLSWILPCNLVHGYWRFGSFAASVFRVADIPEDEDTIFLKNSGNLSKYSVLHRRRLSLILPPVTRLWHLFFLIQNWFSGLVFTYSGNCKVVKTLIPAYYLFICLIIYLWLSNADNSLDFDWWSD